MFLTKHFLFAAIGTMFLCVLIGDRDAAALQECEVIGADNIQLIEPLHVLRFPKTDKYGDPLTDIAWMPNSDGFAVAAGLSGLWTYQLNNIKNPQVSDHEPVFRVRFDPTGQLRATKGEGNIKILNQETSASLEIESSQGTLSFMFSPDGTRLYGWSSRAISVWDVDTGVEILRHERNYAGGYPRTVFSHDGSTIIEANYDALVVRDAITLEEISRRQLANAVIDLAVNPDDRFLVVSILSSTLVKPIIFLNLETLETLNILPVALHLHGVAFSPDGHLLSVGVEGGSLIWDMTDTTILSEKVAPIRKLSDHSGQLITVQFSPDGKYLLSAGYDDGKVVLWGVCS